MSPKFQALKAALERLDKTPSWGSAYINAQKALHAAATAAGFTPQRAVEDWVRYQVAVGESAEQLVEVEEPDPLSGELFG